MPRVGVGGLWCFPWFFRAPVEWLSTDPWLEGQRQQPLPLQAPCLLGSESVQRVPMVRRVCGCVKPGPRATTSARRLPQAACSLGTVGRVPGAVCLAVVTYTLHKIDHL